jgi:hypothetical protein
VLQQLLGSLAVPSGLASSQQVSPVPALLRPRIISVTLRAYHSLSRAAYAIGSPDTAAKLVEEALLLCMKLQDSCKWKALGPLLYELRLQMIAVDRITPYSLAAELLYRNIVQKHKVRDGWCIT